MTNWQEVYKVNATYVRSRHEVYLVHVYFWRSKCHFIQFKDGIDFILWMHGNYNKYNSKAITISTNYVYKITLEVYKDKYSAHKEYETFFIFEMIFFVALLTDPIKQYWIRKGPFVWQKHEGKEYLLREHSIV